MTPDELLRTILKNREVRPTFVLRAKSIKAVPPLPDTPPDKELYLLAVEVFLRYVQGHDVSVAECSVHIPQETLDHMTPVIMCEVETYIAQVIGQDIQELILEVVMCKNTEEVLHGITEGALAPDALDEETDETTPSDVRSPASAPPSCGPVPPTEPPRPSPPPPGPPPPDLPFEDPTQSPLPPPMMLNAPDRMPTIKPEQINPPPDHKTQ